MRVHIVQKGDTLWKIAKQYSVGFDELKRLNAHLANPDYIVPGMEIYLPNDQQVKEKPKEHIKERPIQPPQHKPSPPQSPPPQVPQVPQVPAPQPPMKPSPPKGEQPMTPPIQWQPQQPVWPEFNFYMPWHIDMTQMQQVPMRPQQPIIPQPPIHQPIIPLPELHESPQINLPTLPPVQPPKVEPVIPLPEFEEGPPIPLPQNPCQNFPQYTMPQMCMPLMPPMCCCQMMMHDMMWAQMSQPQMQMPMQPYPQQMPLEEQVNNFQSPMPTEPLTFVDYQMPQQTLQCPCQMYPQTPCSCQQMAPQPWPY